MNAENIKGGKNIFYIEQIMKMLLKYFASMVLGIVVITLYSCSSKTNQTIDNISITDAVLGQPNIYLDSRGDTWDATWADDDAIYSSSDDSRGFRARVNSNLMVNKLEGQDPNNLKGTTINTMDEYGKAGDLWIDGNCWKANGMSCIDGVLYLFVSRHDYNGESTLDPWRRQDTRNASLIKSSDHGITWSRTAIENYKNPMFPGTRFSTPFFIHYGKNGAANVDNGDKYVYAMSNNGFWCNGDDMILGRVLKTEISNLDGSDWAYYTGGNGMLDSNWTKDMNKAFPIISNRSKLSMNGATYIPSLRKYVMIQWYHAFGSGEMSPQESILDFYEAPDPWGPWSRFKSGLVSNPIAYYDIRICSKWQKRTGNDASVVVFTGGVWGSSYYKCTTIPCTLKTKTTTVPKTAFFVGIDSTTKGAWRKKYGSDGYMLFNYEDGGRNLQAIPEFIKGISLSDRGFFYAGSTNDPNIPENPTNKAKKTSYVFATSPCTEFRSVDTKILGIQINSTDTITFKDLALYFYEPGGKNNINGTVQVRDDKNRFLDMQPISNISSNPVYYRYKVKGSVKVNLVCNSLYGTPLLINGMFWGGSNKGIVKDPDEGPIFTEAKFSGFDFRTKGSWKGKYGDDGYVLCNYLNNNNDVQSLPSFIKSITYNDAAFWYWGKTEDSDVLEPVSGERISACAYRNNSLAKSFSVDIVSKDFDSHQLALYFYDPDKNNYRAGTVEIINYDTGIVLDKRDLVNLTTSPSYLKYVVRGSIKVKIACTRGGNLGLQGIFWGY